MLELEDYMLDPPDDEDDVELGEDQHECEDFEDDEYLEGVQRDWEHHRKGDPL